MAIETISYSVASNGWDSFHSYVPDWMMGLNSSLYTWKDGELYKHNTNTERNNYYGTGYDSTITPIFNQEPMNNKVYKTIALWSNIAWKANITTDFTTGVVDSTFFELKEGEWYGYIRRPVNTVDLKAISTQGLGSSNWDAGTNTFSFTFGITSNISIGDDIYVTADPALIALQKVGTITSLSIGSGSSTITVDSAAITPNNGDFTVAIKSSQAESYGARGSYMEVRLNSESRTGGVNEGKAIDLLTISSDATRSYP